MAFNQAWSKIFRRGRPCVCPYVRQLTHQDSQALLISQDFSKTFQRPEQNNRHIIVS
jgi:hypothetical protein